MSLLYDFEIDTVGDIQKILAQNFQKRRLEKGLSRNQLSEISGVPSATIAKFEQKHTISLTSYIALAKALGYAKDIKKLLSQPLYETMEELDVINKNKKRKRGRRNEAGR
jgi:Helix-turn-helix.